MAKLSELKQLAKARGLKGYSALKKADLQKMLDEQQCIDCDGRREEKKEVNWYLTLSLENRERLMLGRPLLGAQYKHLRLKKTKTSPPICEPCEKNRELQREYRDEIEQRKTTIHEGLEIDVESGEVVGSEMCYDR